MVKGDTSSYNDNIGVANCYLTTDAKRKQNTG